MSDAAPVFMRTLESVQKRAGAGARAWVYAHEDQLTDQIGPLARLKPEQTGLILIEDRHKCALRPYHVQRLAVVRACQRQFALEQARRGVRVRYVIGQRPCGHELLDAAKAVGAARVTMMTPAEREARAHLAPAVERGVLAQVPHEGWLTTTQQFEGSHAGARGSPRWKMDTFYRHVRRETGILMDKDGQFVGGKVSFDTENREPWSGAIGQPAAPTPPTFEPDDVTREVLHELRAQGTDQHHPGTLDERAVPATQADAQRLWTWAKAHCLTHFGPYEDAMSTASSGVFHTRISTLMNLHRLLPSRVVKDVEALDVPLASKEGFIRQVLGWREFVRHVHEATDGFRRQVPRARQALQPPGDGGFARWRAGDKPEVSEDGPMGLVPAFWPHGGAHASGLACLDRVVADVWREGWSHHITRLMVLCNIASLLELSARELCDWFWVAYTDAWDWVVEPNVLAMGTYATGDVMTTKPYISGAAYIDKMSDYCASCRFVPGKTCPLTALYWAFLDRHAKDLEGNGRMLMPLRSLAKRSARQRQADRATFVHVREVLVQGRALTPAGVARAQGAGGPS
jgi:deoxyribodipyrimidine photolyase-related protein